LFDDADVSRTVGWFTTICPVLLDVERVRGLADALRNIKEQLRRMPGRGIGYGLLRWMSGDAEAVRQFSQLPEPEVGFNYLGQFAGAESSDEDAFPIGPSRSPHDHRPWLIEINGSVAGGRLTLDWTYSENLHARKTIESLAADYLSTLRELIAHCVTPGAGGYTPSDFARARVSQRDLDTLLGKIAARKGSST
jgi:non-ribosomal peptide synthase protein (TIGR01720 family)